MSINVKVEPKTALITGGDSGIGYAIAHELAGRGYNLVLVSNQEKKLKEVSEELEHQYKINSWPVFMDLAKSGAAINLYNWCKTEKLTVGVLVNNAGIFFFGEVVETKSEMVRQMILLHIETTTLLCAHFGREMKRRRAGHILNISSLSAYMPYPGIAFYSATKTFLKSFSRSLRTEMKDYNVNVTCVLPGAVSTGLFELSKEKRKKLIKTGIMMRADKLAKLAVNAMFRRKSILIPGIVTRIFLMFTHLVPNSVILLIRRHSKFLPPEKL